jgi:outer membrane protein assembly factor BamB
LAVALAQQSQLLVHATDADSANVASSRSLATAAAVLGRRVYVETASPSPNLLADNHADLVVMYDLTDGDLASLSPTELLRVVTPVNGHVIVGAHGGIGLTQSALQTWADGFGVPVTVETDAQGLWAHVRKPALAGADDWTHRFHGPDNNPVSTDQAYSYPHMTQWMGKPYHDVGNVAEFHVANGRVAVMSKCHSAWNNHIKQNLFYARNFYNGQVLWQRDLPFKYLTGNGAMVLSGDSVLMCLGLGAAVLDAASGAELGRITFQGVTGCAKWIGLADNVVVLLAGGNDCSLDFPDPATITSKMIKDSCFYAPQPDKNCTEIAAYDLATRQTLWRHAETSPIDLRFIAAHDGAVYFLSHGSRAVALNLRTGAQLWENTTQALHDATTMEPSLLNGMFEAQRGITLHPQVVLFGMEYSHNYVGLSRANGQLLWSFPRSMIDRSPVASLVLGDEFWMRRRVLSVLTGDSLKNPRPPLAGCGAFSAGPGMIYGQCGVSMNTTTGATYGNVNGMHKSPCEVGAFIANGLYLNPPYGCTCKMITRGYKVMAPVGSFVPNDSATTAQRLTTGSGNISSVQPLAVDGSDWPTYRHNNQRTAGTPVAVSASPHVMWTYTPAILNTQEFAGRFATRLTVDHRPTQPVTAGDYLFVGNTDGTVACVDATTGGSAWTYATGGSIVAAPTVSNGRVYVGSCDGCAYALEARTGRLLWRFRAAPVERRVMFFGQLMSTWPVITGVLVDSGVAYFAGGYNAEDGAHVYAVNAVDGTIVWQNNAIAANAGIKDMGRGPRGGLAIARGRLWMRTANTATCAFDLQTGDLKPGPCDPENWSNKRQGFPGQDIAVLNNRFVLYGGQRLFSDHCEYGGTEDKLARWATYSFLELDAQGEALYPEVAPFIKQHSLHPPAWDSEVMVVVTTEHRDAWGWSTPQTESFLAAERTANAGNTYSWWQESRVYHEDPSVLTMKLWGPLDIRVNASMVAQNAVVMAYTDDDGTTWKLGGFSKQTGASLWNVALPLEPAFSGVSVNRSGTIAVALRDGRVLGIGGGAVGVVAGGMPTHAPRSTPVTHAAVSNRGWTTQPSTAPVTVAADTRQPWQYAQTEPTATDVPEPELYAPYNLPRYVHRDMSWHSDLPGLAIREAHASSTDGRHEPACIFDRDLRTRWAASDGAEQWLVLDLGAPHLVSSVSFVWYSPHRDGFELRVEVSMDGEHYSEVDAGVLTGRGTDTTLRSFLATRARYVRLSFLPGPQVSPPSVYEVALHGAAAP